MLRGAATRSRRPQLPQPDPVRKLNQVEVASAVEEVGVLDVVLIDDVRPDAAALPDLEGI